MTERKLGYFEEYVIIAVGRLCPHATATNIRRDIESRTCSDVEVGVLYAALGRLAQKKMLNKQILPPNGRQGGRQSSAYTVTALGQETIAVVQRERAAMYAEQQN